MTRETMASAISMGLRRSIGKDAESQKDSVLMAIEMAMELESSFNGSPATPKVARPAAPVEDSTAPPPNPDAVEEFRAVDVKQDTYSPTEYPSPSPELDSGQHPQPPALKNLVVLASNDADIDKAASDAKRPRVRSVFMRSGGPKIKLEDVMGWIVQNFPAKITVTPKGAEQPVTLDRKVYAIPCTVENKESVGKVSYNHPKLDSTMEVGLGIRVGTVAEQGYPVVQDVLDRIKLQAIELYKTRPAMIEGAMPSGPTLDGAFRAMTAPKAKIPAMKFADADQPLMFPDVIPAAKP